MALIVGSPHAIMATVGVRPTREDWLAARSAITAMYMEDHLTANRIKAILKAKRGWAVS